ncbi:hypothetical protein [Phenylobacterium sp.]|uniref:hypothetical protein n=1 Tax=Phenylobacterium sp. TaxID=1871053 RepID=UPI0025F3F79D|nr:hypothetical protein [Phenylobacterium sp.]
MGNGADTSRPIWRRPLAAVLVAWMLLVVGGALTSARLMEILPGETALVLAIAGLVAPVPVLLVWGFWTMLREPVTGWIAPTVLLTFGGSLIPALQPLLDAGVRLNFEAHRPVYEAVVADVSLRPPSGHDHWVSGVREEVRYRYRADRPGEIDFAWAANGEFRTGVRYDDSPCVPRPGHRCIDRGRPLGGHYNYYQMLF